MKTWLKCGIVCTIFSPILLIISGLIIGVILSSFNFISGEMVSWVGLNLFLFPSSFFLGEHNSLILNLFFWAVVFFFVGSFIGWIIDKIKSGKQKTTL